MSDATDIVDAVVGPWRDFVALLEADLPFDTERIRVDGMRFTLAYLAAGLNMAIEGDPAYPQFLRFADALCSWGINNPDGNYALLPLDGRGTYRITGDLGTAPVIEFQVHAPTFLGAPDYRITGATKRADLEVAADGSVELWLGGEPRSGNWMPLTPDAESVLFRQFFGSWDDQRPARLAVERMDLPYPPTPVSRADLDARLGRLVRWFTDAGVHWHAICKATLGAGDNRFVFHPASFSDAGGHQGQSYGFGVYRLAPDEALVIEIDPPANAYWSVQLANRFWDSFDYDRRQSSLNMDQMHLDADGRFRGVVAVADPGVANWLDPAGNPWGSIMGRFLDPVATPVATCTVVPITELGSFLPADTRWVTAEERSDTLRRRHVAHQLRQGF